MIKDINMPLFLMNIPTCYSTNVRNNIWMEEYTAKDIVVNKEKIVGVISLSDILNCYDDLDKVIMVVKAIWYTTKNNDNYKTEIDDFYLRQSQNKF